jgi:7-carboxy-7-deazaguanine synthase
MEPRGCGSGRRGRKTVSFELNLEVREQKALTLAEKRRPDVLRINEIFYSIQGESSRAGERCIFVRMTGCGLRCSYCDTEYAFFEGADMPVASVFDRVREFECKLVELTGGEPLEQEGVYPLIDRLLSEGYDVMIETGGHVDISRVDRRVKRIVDLKTPSSGMQNRNLFSNMAALTPNDEVKFVIGSREDYDWAKEKIEAYDIAAKAGTILFSPVHGVLPEHELAEWILTDKMPVRFQVQLHKIIWPATLRGV